MKVVAGAKGFFPIDFTKKSDTQLLKPFNIDILSSRLVMVEIFQKNKKPKYLPPRSCYDHLIDPTTHRLQPDFFYPAQAFKAHDPVRRLR